MTQAPMPHPGGPPAYPRMLGIPFEPRTTIRVGLIGVGARGQRRLQQLQLLSGFQVVAVCDTNPVHLAEVQTLLRQGGLPEAWTYGGDPEAYLGLCRRGDLDLIFIDTPWEWHVPMAVEAMTHGAHVGVEVPAATTLEGCWALVDTSERTRRHCLMLQNTCYGLTEQRVLALVREGFFGELTHAEGAYLHDLREILFQDHGVGLWRRVSHRTLNGNLYPTHGLGPLCWCLGIHRGDRLVSLASFSSPERSLSAYRDRLEPGDPRRQERYVCGDLNTSILTTERGLTILLQHAVTLPRPYSRRTALFGTLGCFEDQPPRVWQDGLAPGKPEWQPLEGPLPPLWRETQDLRAALQDEAHEMDLVMLYRLAQCLREGLPPDLDVYDAAAWSAPVALSIASVAQGGAVVPFPDFRRTR